MAQPDVNSFRFTIQNNATGEQRKFERPLFPPDLKTLLVEFCECAKNLNKSAFVKNWPNFRGSLHFANDGRITNTGAMPSDEEIAAFLHWLRPLYLNDERTNFHKITQRVGRHLDDAAITKCIRSWKRFYDGRASQELFTISIGGKLVNSDEFFGHYVNALEYHRDSARRQHIDKIAERFPLEAQKSIFVLLLVFRLNAINKFASFLLTCFDRENGRPITLEVT